MQGFPPSTPMTQQSFVAPTPTQVQTPRMGGISYQGPYAYAWTGGEPKADWSGLKDPESINVNPLRLRSNSVKAARDFEDRQSGLYPGEEAKRFTKGNSLHKFLEKINDSFKDYGMDTIAYQRDPRDRKVVVNILINWPRLNQVEMKEESIWCLARFDSHDKENDTQAKKFFLASLCNDLECEVSSRADDNDTLVDLLFHLIDEERPGTMNTHLADIDRIKVLTPAAHPNVNVKTHHLHVRDKIEILEKANHYDSAPNETICRNLATCVAGNPEYSNPLYAMLDKITDENQALTCMNNREKIVHMKKLKLSWRNVLDLALSKYQAQMVT